MSPVSPENSEASRIEMRLMIEELCCALLRFEHASERRPEEVRVRRELPLGFQNAYADVLIIPPESDPYYLEVDFGYSNDEIIASVQRKYLPLLQTDRTSNHARKLVLFFDTANRTGVEELVATCRSMLAPEISVETLNEHALDQLAKKHLNVSIPHLEPSMLADVRTAIDQAKGTYAFAPIQKGAYQHDPLKAYLLWSFDFWKVRSLIEKHTSPDQIMRAGVYEKVVVLIADLCSFSSFVRETPDTDITRANLVSFYSKARHAIIGNGGFLYQFVGDSVIGCFGMPDQNGNASACALKAATELCHVGASVTNRWQRQIDREQNYHGTHIGIAMGELHLMPLRPFSRTHQGLVGDCINMASRLMDEAKEGEIIVSNVFYQSLPPESQSRFTTTHPVEAKNVGRIKSWITRIDSGMP